MNETPYASRLTLRQKKRFVDMMKQFSGDNITLWNNFTLRHGGYDVTALAYKDGVSDEDVIDCWSISQLMGMEELYSLHIDIPNLYFKVPPPPPPPPPDN